MGIFEWIAALLSGDFSVRQVRQDIIDTIAELDALVLQLDADTAEAIRIATVGAQRASEDLITQVGGTASYTIDPVTEAVTVAVSGEGEIGGRIGARKEAARLQHAGAVERYDRELDNLIRARDELLGNQAGTDYKGYYGELRRLDAQYELDAADRAARLRTLNGYTDSQGNHVRGTHEIALGLADLAIQNFKDSYDAYVAAAEVELANMAILHDQSIEGMNAQIAAGDVEVARRQEQIIESRDQMRGSIRSQAILAMNEGGEQGAFAIGGQISEASKVKGEAQLKAASSRLRLEGSPLLMLRRQEAENRESLARAQGREEYNMTAAATRTADDLAKVWMSSNQSSEDLVAGNILFDAGMALQIENTETTYHQLYGSVDAEGNPIHGTFWFSNEEWKRQALISATAAGYQRDALLLQQAEESRILGAAGVASSLALRAAKDKTNVDITMANRAYAKETADIIGTGSWTLETDPTGFRPQGGAWKSENDRYTEEIRILNAEADDARTKHDRAIVDISGGTTYLTAEYLRRKTFATTQRGKLKAAAPGMMIGALFGAGKELLAQTRTFLNTSKTAPVTNYGTGTSYITSPER